MKSSIDKLFHSRKLMIMTHRLIFTLCNMHSCNCSLQDDEIHIYGKEEQGENERTIEIARQSKLWPNCSQRYGWLLIKSIRWIGHCFICQQTNRSTIFDQFLLITFFFIEKLENLILDMYNLLYILDILYIKI